MDQDRATWDETRLLALITNGTQESLTLDYKRSPSLDKTSSSRAELSKDVSAFANSAGGLLIYGMEEDRHVPTRIDDGYDPSVMTKEWVENIITSWIHPRVDGLRVFQVPLQQSNPGRVVYVIETPQATTLAPHQASDHKYYKRFNFKSEPMEDYEVPDLLRRATTPDLRCLLLLGVTSAFNPYLYYDRVVVNFREDWAYSDPIRVQLGIENLSAEPAPFAIISIDVPQDLLHVPSPNTEMRTTGSPMSTRFEYRHGAPGDFPLWNGEIWLPERAYFTIAVPANARGSSWDLVITASAPGMRRRSEVRFLLDFNTLQLVDGDSG